MSWLGRLNYYLLQWMYIRMYKTVELDGSISEWGIMYWVKPMSGWSSKYKWVKDTPNYLRLR